MNDNLYYNEYKKYKALHSNAYIIAVDHNPRPLKDFQKRKDSKKSWRVSSIVNI